MIVALSGYYGVGNVGDEAILLAITRELKRLGHVPIVLSQNPQHTSKTFGVSSAHARNILALWRTLNKADAVLSGGGGLLQDKTSRRTLQYYLTIIRFAKWRKKRVAVFNQSIGPLSSEGEKAVSQTLQGVKAIVRDSSSVAYLEQLGVKASLGGDPALLLDPKEFGELPDWDDQSVVLAPRGGQPGATARLVELGQHLANAGRKVIALSFQPGVDTPELEAMKLIPGVKLEETDDPVKALLRISSAGMVVGVRLHAVILAAAAGTPFVGVSYDPKVAGFCQDAKAPSVGTDFDVQSVLKMVLERQAPDWEAVQAMRDRARASFKQALRS